VDRRGPEARRTRAGAQRDHPAGRRDGDRAAPIPPRKARSGAALDQTVKVAVDFARRHPGTLIVVQGDHETGGLTIENPDGADETGDALSREDGPFAVKGTQLNVFADWTTGQHTGADTPITASGPGSEAFDGVIDNTDVHDAVARAMRGR
jgi:alkaline phosphatase